MLDKACRARDGVTLIELLVVLGVVSIMIALSAQGLGTSKKGTDVTTANGIVSGVFREAGLAARTLNRPARVLICIDSGESKKYLRFIGIEVEETDENGLSKWTPLGKGSYLPEGVRIFDEYLNVAYSPGAAPSATVSSSFPKDPGQDQKNWLCFNVNSRGFFEQAGRVLVVGLSDGAETQGNVARRKGVVILKSGVPLALESLPAL